jgi:hypothetical protein
MSGTHDLWLDQDANEKGAREEGAVAIPIAA